MRDPIIIGGNGHSGTRIFTEILAFNGVFMGIPRITRSPSSSDLQILDLLDKWVYPYVYGLMSTRDVNTMQTEFRRRLRLFFPFRTKPWGFKNPRTMLILPVLHTLFPDMKFIHVIRDGRDISLGNPFVQNNVYVDAFLTQDEKNLSPAEKMILFWGRSNTAARDFCERFLTDSYLPIKFEDLCRNPGKFSPKLLEFSDCPKSKLTETERLVKLPKSIGRWKQFDSDIVRKVESLGAPFLGAFGYS